MQSSKIAVSSDLGHVRNALQDEGYTVVDLSGDLHGVGAVVISGRQRNFLGYQGRASDAPVIDATSMTANEVVEAVRRQVAPRTEVR